MKKTTIILLFLTLITSCKSTQKSTVQKINIRLNTNTKADKIIKNAENYLHTKYKYGGTTKKGMDCSGLVFTVYKQEKIILPRTSYTMSLKGKAIPLKQTKKGDLLFFATGKKNKINHVGLVSKIKNHEIFFIHASTKRGVITSSMNEKYYRTRFIKAKRILL